MTKEAILTDKYQRETGMFLAEKGWYKWQLDAMDEYAKTTSLAYDQWKIENRWFSFENGYWYQTHEQGTVMSEKIYNKHHRKTPEQLYNQFIEQQNKE